MNQPEKALLAKEAPAMKGTTESGERDATRESGRAVVLDISDLPFDGGVVRTEECHLWLCESQLGSSEIWAPSIVSIIADVSLARASRWLHEQTDDKMWDDDLLTSLKRLRQMCAFVAAHAHPKSTSHTDTDGRTSREKLARRAIKQYFRASSTRPSTAAEAGSMAPIAQPLAGVDQQEPLAPLDEGASGVDGRHARFDGQVVVPGERWPTVEGIFYPSGWCCSQCTSRNVNATHGALLPCQGCDGPRETHDRGLGQKVWDAYNGAWWRAKIDKICPAGYRLVYEDGSGSRVLTFDCSKELMSSLVEAHLLHGSTDAGEMAAATCTAPGIEDDASDDASDESDDMPRPKRLKPRVGNILVEMADAATRTTTFEHLDAQVEPPLAEISEPILQGEEQPTRTEEVLATFGDNVIGIFWLSGDGHANTADRPSIGSIKDKTPAAAVPGLRPGMQLYQINGDMVDGMGYKKCLAMIREKSRPISLTFRADISDSVSAVVSDPCPVPSSVKPLLVPTVSHLSASGQVVAPLEQKKESICLLSDSDETGEEHGRTVASFASGSPINVDGSAGAGANADATATATARAKVQSDACALGVLSQKKRKRLDKKRATSVTAVTSKLQKLLTTIRTDANTAGSRWRMAVEFVELPVVAGYTDYVRHPMALCVVERKLVDQEYPAQAAGDALQLLVEVEQDLELMVSVPHHHNLTSILRVHTHCTLRSLLF